MLSGIDLRRKIEEGDYQKIRFLKFVLKLRSEDIASGYGISKRYVDRICSVRL